MLIDTTLREGQQQYGVYAGRDRKEELLLLALKSGVDEVEIGVAGHDQDELRGLALLAGMRKRSRQAVGVWCPCRPEAVALAAELPVDRVTITAPVSDAHLRAKLGIDRQELLRRLAETLAVGRSLGLPYISVGLEDVSRADAAFALTVAKLARDAGAARVRLADTVGVLTPMEIIDLVRTFKARTRLAVAVHCHNDFGMATANALSALDTGADYADASALGLGERAGLASLEQLMGYLTLKRGLTRYDLDAAAQLCRVAAQTRDGRVSESAPIVGERLFWAESGLHVDGIYKEPTLYEPFAPEAVGLTRRLAVGAKSGAAAVRRKLAELGMADAAGDQEPERVEQLVRRVRNASRSKGAALEDAEVRVLAG